MRASKSIKKLFFILTVKSPVTVLLIILFTTSSLTYIAYSNFTSVYVKAQGGNWIDNSSDGQASTYVEMDKKYLDYIKEGNPVIWYTDEGNKRYNASIGEVKNLKDKDKLEIRISASMQDVKAEKAKASTVEVYVKKVRILDKLLNKEGGV